MSGAYVRAIQDSLAGFLNLLVRLALPLAILFGLAIVALAIGYYLRRDSAEESLPVLKKALGRLAGFALVSMTFVVCWSALRQTRPVAVDAFRWKDASQEVSNPTEDAPAVYQSGPVAASLKEQTFTRTLILPSQIADQIVAAGSQAVANYAGESSSSNVLEQTEKLEKRGNNYTLVRQVRRLQENPVPFQKSEVKAKFAPVGGRAYTVEFDGSYSFKNPGSEAANIRFTFPLPQSGTVSNLKIQVGSDTITQPAPSGNYEWSGMMQPGESKTAKVTYHVVGARVWNYDIGSQRRPVEEFSLDITSRTPLKFTRGSLQPTTGGANPSWKLSNVVTNQQVSVNFPSDRVGRETFIQTMAMLPAALAIFMVGLWLVTWRFKLEVEPAMTALCLLLFAFGLGGASVLANYLGNIAGVFASLAAGVTAVTAILGSRSLFASVPSALFAAAFLSPEHTGLIVGITAVATLGAYAFACRGAVPKLA